MIPRELSLLAELRRRGQCPTMTVFVTDNWQWADKLEDLGCLAIRVRVADFNHDWSPLCGLEVILLVRFGDIAPLGQAILAANPAKFETFTLREGAQLVCGSRLPHRARWRRDELLVKHLVSA